MTPEHVTEPVALETTRDAVADAVTLSLLVRHHAAIAHAAAELDEAPLLRDYALWCRDVLDARGIDVALLVRTLESSRAELLETLSPPAAESVARAVDLGLEMLGRHGPVHVRAGGVAPGCHLYLAAAITGRRGVASYVAHEAVRTAPSVVDVYVDVFEAALHEIGRRWQAGRLTIAEEHMATATTQFILGLLHEEVHRSRHQRGTAVVTGLGGERHVVGATMVANVLDEDGWDVRYLGSDLPNDEIAATVLDTGAALLAVSVTMSGGVAQARDLIALVRERSAEPPRILVGGAPFRADPGLWRAVGADGFAPDARSVAAAALG